MKDNEEGASSSMRSLSFNMQYLPQRNSNTVVMSSGHYKLSRTPVYCPITVLSLMSSLPERQEPPKLLCYPMSPTLEMLQRLQYAQLTVSLPPSRVCV